MYNVLLVIHIMVTLALIVTILVQRSSSDGMGLSGSSSNSFMSGRAAASFVTRATSLLAAAFILTSLSLGILVAHKRAGADSSIMDTAVPDPTTLAPTATTNALKPMTKPAPAKPAVPRPE